MTSMTTTEARALFAPEFLERLRTQQLTTAELAQTADGIRRLLSSETEQLESIRSLGKALDRCTTARLDEIRTPRGQRSRRRIHA